MEDEAVYTTEEVADLLKTTEFWVHEQCRKGTLGHFRLGTRKGIRITGADIKAYIAQRHTRSQFLKRKEPAREQA